MVTELEIKPAFHQLIDEIENKKYLKELYDSISGLVSSKRDVLDGLSAEETAKTKEAISQIENGKYETDAIVRQRIAKKWNIK
jgi:hypothetical protein